MRAYRHTFRVIYGDTDAMGIVYYANYLRYFEAGRNELLRSLGLTYREFESTGWQLPVISASAQYKSPARYDDELTLETRITEVRYASVRIAYTLLRGTELLTTGETMHACIGPEGRPARFPPIIQQKLRAGAGVSE